MDISFSYSRERQYYTLQFRAGAFETVPFISELRFWGVDRFPCPRLSTLAALIVLKNHPLDAVTLNDAEINPPVCSALSQFFGVEIHNKGFDPRRRDLAGGDMCVAPSRFAPMQGPQAVHPDAEMLQWMSLDDLGGPLGGLVRTNIDAFELSESDKALIVALCCAGKEVGHIILEDADPALAQILHQMGLELVDASGSV